jgi:hypothetical protein
MKMSFIDWKPEVDRQMDRLFGVVSDDLPDMPYYDWYEQGLSPKRAAQLAVRKAKTEVI